MLEGGQRWLPPPMTLTTGSHQTAAQRGGELKVGNFEAESCPAITAMTGGQGGPLGVYLKLARTAARSGGRAAAAVAAYGAEPRKSFGFSKV